MMPSAPVVRLTARWQEVQIGDTPFALVALVVTANFEAVVGDGGEVLLLSTLRRLSGGFAENDMKKEREKTLEGQEW